jgi:hypothetical protein
MRYIWRNKGVSLVELLVVCAMLGIISLSIFATFSNGLKIWSKINKPLAQENVGIFLEKLAGDLSSCLKLNNLPFSGNQSHLEIPTLVDSLNLKNRSIGLAAYNYDQQSGCLARQQKDYSQLYSRQEGNSVILLKGLQLFKFEYYYYDKQKEEYLWLEEWSQEGIPLAVRVVLNLEGQAENEKIIRTIAVAIGG